MATLGATELTILDWVNRKDPNGSIAVIAEILSQSNEMLMDIPFVEGNLPTGHRTTIRSGLPSTTWRMLNYGVQPSKSQTVQVDDACGMLEAWSSVDKDLADLNGNTAPFRLSESRAFIESMGQEAAQTLIYGNSSTAPAEFTGLAPRFNSLSADNGQNIISAGGTGADNTSIWFIVWGPDTCHGIFPKGSVAGLQHEDLGLESVQDANNGWYRAYQDHYQWKLGLTVRDWRYVVRIANIDVSNLVAQSSAADLIDEMIRAMNRVPSMSVGKPCFYVNRTVKTMLAIQALDKSNAALSIEQAVNQVRVSFMGIPIRLSDQIIEAEAQIT